jgi:hypothetical protein
MTKISERESRENKQEESFLGERERDRGWVGRRSPSQNK